MAAAVQSPPTPAHTLDLSSEELPRLRSNYGSYVDPHSMGWMRPTPADTPLSVLRERFEADGYLFIKNLLPREDVLDMRQHYFEHMAPTGLLKPGTSPRDGIFDTTQEPLAHSGVGGSDLPEDIAKVQKLTEAHALDVYHAFLAHPQFRGFVREFMGWERETMVVRNMLRHNVPQGLSTGVHYDRIFLRAGEAEFLTAWIPIGDCAANGGGLTYLEGSTELGKKIEAEFMEKAAHFTPEERISGFNKNMARDGQLSHDVESLGRELCPDGHKWMVANYEAGDVVFHNPYLIHAACKNEDDNGVIRLSSDVRFYNTDDRDKGKIDERWMQLWRPNDGL